MTEQPRPDDLAQLHARLTAQDTRIAQLERRRRLPRRFLPLAIVALLIALVPLTSMAAGFADLNGGPDHAAANADINAIAAAGITKGCNPPDFTNYCPNDVVNREQMASFLTRTAGLGGNAPVVNAKTAETAANAANADKLGGFASNGLVRVASNNSSGSTTLNGNPGDVVTVTIIAPTAGFVIVNGSVSLQGSTSSAATIYIVADGGAASHQICAPASVVGMSSNRSALPTFSR
jgi:hypothetical protein